MALTEEQKELNREIAKFRQALKQGLTQREEAEWEAKLDRLQRRLQAEEDRRLHEEAERIRARQAGRWTYP